MTKKEVRNEFFRIIAEKLGVPSKDINERASFTNDLGADSLDMIELLMECENSLGIQLSDAETQGIYTVGDALDIAYSKLDSSDAPSGNNESISSSDGSDGADEIDKLSVVELFEQYFNNPWSDNDSYAFSCYPYIPEDKLRRARDLFNISPSETILTIHNTAPFWKSMQTATVMTDAAIYYLSEDQETRFDILFSEISEVRYQELMLYFYDLNGEHHATLGIHDLLCYDSYGQEGEHGQYVANLLSVMAEKVAAPVNPYDELIQLEDEGKYDEVLWRQEEAASLGIVPVDDWYHFFRGRVLVKREGTLEEHSEKTVKLIEKEFEKARDLAEDAKYSAYCTYWLAYLYHYIGQPYNARNMFILAMDADSEEMRDDAQEGVIAEEKELSEIWDSYTTTYEYKERKFLMPIRDNEIAGCIVDGIDTFRLSNIPSCIKFPTGHPVANELYIGHPYNPSIYVPYSESEDIFFLDKVDELTYLLQCLGAEDITITSIKGKSVSEYDGKSAQFSAHVDTGTTDVSGSGGKATKREQSYDSRQQHSLHIKCDPMKYPYVPEGLIWYGEQPRWQRMVEGRLNGNRLEYSESISTTDTRFVSNTEKKDIKAAAERLWIKVDGSAEANLETQFKEHTETQWRIDVVFRSLKAFSDTVQEQREPLNDVEHEYLDMYKEYAADGEISERDLKMLDRFRSRCGISEERARELEASYDKPKLTEDEQEYLEMYKEYVADGEISERDRKMLDKMRQRMGISEGRAKEIEQL